MLDLDQSFRQRAIYTDVVVSTGCALNVSRDRWVKTCFTDVAETPESVDNGHPKVIRSHDFL